MSAFDSTMDVEVLPAVPDYSKSLVVQDNDSQGNDLVPQAMSPMDSLRAIFEEIRDGINTLVDLTTKMSPSAADLRDEGVSDADVPPPGSENDSQGNKGFNFEMPEVGPKMGLALMLLGLSALFAYGDEIAKAIEPVLEAGAFVVEKLGVKGTLYTGLGLLAAIKFGPGLISLITKGIPEAFTTLKDSFKSMRKFIFKTAPNAIKDAYGATTKFFSKAFEMLKGAFTAMRTFLFTTAPNAIKGAFGFATDLFVKAFTAVKNAFTAMRVFLLKSLVPTITTAIASVSTALLPVVIGIAAAVAIFTSIKAGIDEFKKSLDEGDSMLVAIIEGVSTALLTLVTLPITLIKNFVAWVAEKLGFEGIAEKLKEFNIVDFIKDGIKNLVLKAKDFVLGLFDIDFKAVLGKFVDIGKSIGRVLKGIALGSIAAVKAAFPGGESPMEAFKRVYDEVSNKGNDTPELPDEADPEADSTVKTMEQVRKEEIAANEAEIDKLETMDEDTLLADGHTAESKIYALEERNADLLSMIYESSMIQTDIAQKALELQEANAGGNVVTTINTTDASNTNNVANNNTNTGGLAVTGKDSTAQALANVGYYGDF